MKLGIIGLGKLGEYYLRDFKKFKIISLVLKNSSPNSSINKTKLINQKYNTKIKPAINYKSFFKINFDTTLICSPSSFHLEHIKMALKKNKDIIIEKPIISLKKEKSKKWALKQLEQILSYNRKIYYNLINEYYAKKYIQLFHNFKFKFKFKNFDFVFHTNGTHNYDEIIDDLIPHFFSVFDKIYQYKKITNIKKIIYKDKCFIKFYADKCFCNIEFLQKSKNKKLKFGFDGYLAERQTIEKKGKISVYLKSKKINKSIKVQNPLTENIKRIVRNHKSYNKSNEYQKIKNNLTKCCEIFYAKK
tara:strand:- start:747 stop:1655 length:909 start_codon:yes stop_codon:yes gene_type:complete